MDFLANTVIDGVSLLNAKPPKKTTGHGFESHLSNIPVIFVTELGKILSIYSANTLLYMYKMYMGRTKINIVYP